MALDDKQEAELRTLLATAEAKRTAAETAAEERRKAMEAQRSAHEAALQTAAAEHAKQLAAVDTERKGWTTERALMERGLVKPEDRVVALALWNAQPEQGRPTLEAYIDGLKADPTKAPHLAHAWGSTAATAQAGQQEAASQGGQQAGAQQRAAGVQVRTETQPVAGQQATVEALRAAGERARRSGTKEDRDAYMALRAKVVEPR
jgi:hypothetical protein